MFSCGVKFALIIHSYIHTYMLLPWICFSESFSNWMTSIRLKTLCSTNDRRFDVFTSEHKQTNKHKNNIVFNPAKSEPWNKNWQKMLLKVEYLLNILKNPYLCINMIEGHERVKTFTTIKWCLLYLLLWSEPWASQLRRKLLPTFNIKQIFVWALCSESWRLRPSEQKGNLLLIFYHS